jgi:choline dehydrogenase-like flavoprotein
MSESVDVVVVGSGPSGAVVSHTLATNGLSVVCLEQGDWVQTSDFPANDPEWELLIQHRWAHDPNVRKLPADYPLDVTDSDMWPVMFNAVGGSSIYFGAEWPRLLPSDFRVKTLDGVCEDWPISYRDLEPFNTAVDKFLGISGVDGDTAYPSGLEYPLPPLPIGKAGLRAAKGLNELGWHWWPGSNAIASFRHGDLEPCVRYGTCEWGCPQGAKASFDRAYWPSALRAGAKLVTGARVSSIETNQQGLASGVVWIDRDGVEQRQEAKAVVLCANGIGTPRMLLMSSNNAHPDGLANSSGLVGKNLMLHPNCTVTAYYDEDLESWKGPAGQLLYSMQFYETDTSRGFLRGSKLHVLPTPGPLAAVDVRRQRDFGDLWGSAFHDAARSHASGLLWAANVEDLPDETNGVTLSASLTDSDGLPAPKINYRLSEMTRASLAFTLDRLQEAALAAGAYETFPVPLWVDQPGHLLGTARMGTDPAHSVVDSWGRSHDVGNLFIADGSIFVTSGSANPTASIAALALRVATGILDKAANRTNTAQT